MTRVLRSFEYFEPGTVEEAAQVLSKHGVKAKLLAGGCDLVPSIGRREIHPDYVVSLGSIPGLDYVKIDRNGLRIGALAKIRSLELSTSVKNKYPLLYEAVHSILKVQVKTMGTLVGNVCVASPASDIVPTLLVLGARLKIASDGSDREIPVEDFFVGVKQSTLKPGEIVTEVFVPKPPAGSGTCFSKLVRTSADIAKVNVAAIVQLSGGTCKNVRIALGSVAPTPMRANDAEKALKGQRLNQKTIQKAADAAAQEIKPIDDVRSTAEYRKETTRILVRRTIQKAMERARA
jgi:carbon-monoxide dehydrogenase medium subunit